MPQPYFPGGQLSVFDTHPELGSQLLEAVMGGTKQKLDKEREQLQKKAQEHSQKMEEVGLITQFLSSQGGLDAIRKMFPGAVPEGATAKPPSMAEQQAGAVASLPEGDPRRQQALLGTTLSGPQLQEKGLQDAGFQMSPVETQRRLEDRTTQFISMFGAPEDKSLARQYAHILGLSALPSSKTMSQQELEVQKRAVAAQEQQARTAMVHATTGAFMVRPGADGKPVLDEATAQKAYTDLSKYLQSGGPIPSEALKDLVPTSDAIKMYVAQHRLQPRTEALIKMLPPLAKMKGKKAEQMATSIMGMILSDPVVTGTTGLDPVSGASALAKDPSLLDKVLAPLARAKTDVLASDDVLSFFSALSLVNPAMGAAGIDVSMEAKGRVRQNKRIDGAIKRVISLGYTKKDAEALRPHLEAADAGQLPGIDLDGAISMVEEELKKSGKRSDRTSDSAPPPDTGDDESDE